MTIKLKYLECVAVLILLLYISPQSAGAQTCTGQFVNGTHMYCINNPPGFDDECGEMPTTQNCSYNSGADTCEVPNVHNDTGCKGKISGVGEVIWWDCTGVYAHPYREVCGPANPDPTPPGQTPPPGSTPTPVPGTNATFKYIFDGDHNGLIASNVCTNLGSGVDRYIKGSTVCAGCVAYVTLSGITTKGVTHHNQCVSGATETVPQTLVNLTTNEVAVVMPAGRYVINRNTTTGTCSMVNGNPYLYTCPNGGTETLLVSDVNNACSISVTGPSSLVVGQSGNLSVTKVGTGAITDIWIDSSAPNPDGAVSYSGTPVAWNGTPSPHTGLSITGDESGGATVTVKGVNSATGIQCSASYNLTVTPTLTPWWVTFGGDITAGDIIYSEVPAGWYLFNYTSSVASGMPIYNTNVYYGSGTLSDTDRRVDTLTYNLNPSYASLYAKADKNVTTPFIPLTLSSMVLADFDGNAAQTKGISYGDWEWYVVNPAGGTLTLDTAAFTFSDRKVVVFVNGNLVVNRNIQCVDGVGMPVFVVSGNITFNSSVAAATTLFEGAYYAGGNITFNSNGAQTDPLLTVRSILVAGGSVVNNRDRGVSNNSYAINYTRTPDLLFLLPSFMGSKHSLWREVAP